MDVWYCKYVHFLLEAEIIYLKFLTTKHSIAATIQIFYRNMACYNGQAVASVAYTPHCLGSQALSASEYVGNQHWYC